MHVVALPGRRFETEAWLKNVLAAAALPQSGVVRYRHWDTDTDASVAFEASRLADQAPALVVAKSLGTLIAATAFCRHGFRPAAAVLIGAPYAALEDGDVQFLQRFAAGVDTLFIQQRDDPGGTAAQLHTALQVASANVVAVPGDDHLYSDTGELGSIIRRWIARRPTPEVP